MKIELLVLACVLLPEVVFAQDVSTRINLDVCSSAEATYMNMLASKYIGRENIDGINGCFRTDDTMLYAVPLHVPVSVVNGEDFLKGMYGSNIVLDIAAFFDGWEISVSEGGPEVRVNATVGPTITLKEGLADELAALIMREPAEFYFMLSHAPFN